MARHLGEYDQYRILFAGLAELDDEQVRSALAAGYRRFAALIRTHVETSRTRGRSGVVELDSEVAAWAIVGLGTIATMARELGVLGAARRRKLIADVGRALLASARS